MGRPKGTGNKQKAQIVTQICERISEGMSLRKATLNNIPVSKSVFLLWCSEDKTFSDQYARAIDARTEVMADDILDISDDSSNDTIQGEYGPMENKEWVNRSKLRVESRKWLMSKMMPKKYGDKLDVTSGGKELPTAPPVINVYEGNAPKMADNEDDIDDERQTV